MSGQQPRALLARALVNVVSSTSSTSAGSRCQSTLPSSRTSSAAGSKKTLDLSQPVRSNVLRAVVNLAKDGKLSKAELRSLRKDSGTPSPEEKEELLRPQREDRDQNRSIHPFTRKTEREERRTKASGVAFNKKTFDSEEEIDKGWDLLHRFKQKREAYKRQEHPDALEDMLAAIRSQKKKRKKSADQEGESDKNTSASMPFSAPDLSKRIGAIHDLQVPASRRAPSAIEEGAEWLDTIPVYEPGSSTPRQKPTKALLQRWIGGREAPTLGTPKLSEEQRRELVDTLPAPSHIASLAEWESKPFWRDDWGETTKKPSPASQPDPTIEAYATPEADTVITTWTGEDVVIPSLAPSPNASPINVASAPSLDPSSYSGPFVDILDDGMGASSGKTRHVLEQQRKAALSPQHAEVQAVDAPDSSPFGDAPYNTGARTERASFRPQYKFTGGSRSFEARRGPTESHRQESAMAKWDWAMQATSPSGQQEDPENVRTAKEEPSSIQDEDSRLASEVADLIARRRPSPRAAYVEETPAVSGIISKNTLNNVVDVHPDYTQGPVARLAHQLDRVLFNPGVHWLRDPHSGVYNFEPYLQTVPKLDEFDFKRLHPYVRSSHDATLRHLAIREGKKYTGSSSSLTGIMAHVYRLISGEKPVNLESFSLPYGQEPTNFTISQMSPTKVRMTQRDGVWSLDPDDGSSGDNDKHVLMWMGTMLEKFLTKTPEEFNQLKVAAPPLEQEPQRETYRYAMSDKFLLRGQLDCIDNRLPGTGVFDIKTRATMLVRLDRFNMDAFAGYEIRELNGLFESYEREEYDMIRSAFLKYILQARIGNMDGVIVAYHNTIKIMGFQYFSVDAMEKRVYGESGYGERIFQQTLKLLEETLDVAASIFPESPISLMFDKDERSDVLNVFVSPLSGFPADRVPIAMLTVECQSIIGTVAVSRSKGLLADREDWKLAYTITRSPASRYAIREAHEAAIIRTQLGFPRVGERNDAEMDQLYRGYNVFGRPATTADETDGGTAEPAPDSMQWFRPSQKIQDIRNLARKGLKRIQAEEKRRTQEEPVVWTPYEPGSDDASPDRD